MVIKVLQKGPSKCAFTQMHQTIKQKLNQESKNWYKKKSENFTKNEMICTSKWFSNDVGKFEFI
jgi:hypothetical protein